MSLRLLTPLLALMITSQLSAGDRPEGDRPQGPPPGALFERFDQNGDHLLSRPEFMRGMAELQRPRPEGGDQERPRPEGGDGEGRPRPENGEGRPPRPPADGEGRPRPENGEGRPPRPPADGEGRPRPPADGEGRPRPEGGGQLEKAFDKGDADKSGTLTHEEFRAAMQSMPRPPANRPPGQGQGEGEGEGDRPRPPKKK